MSLKLDELRKRLLQQQSGRDGAAPEPSGGAPNGKVFNIVPPMAEPAATPKVSEQPVAAASDSEPAAAQAPEPSSVESKIPATEAPVMTAESKPSDAEISDPRESASSLRSEPEPEETKSRFGAVAIASEPVGQHELAEAVGKVFEQTKAFQARLEDLGRIFEPIDRMGNSAVRAFAPLRGFQQQMAQLARSFEPMRTFQQQLSQLAQNFEPMKALEGQLSQLADSFQAHLGDLIKSLEPAKQMRDRIEQLGAAFDQATELQERFTELYDAFQLSPSNGRTNGLDSQDGAVR